MNHNIEMIDEVSILLDDLTEDIVFVGGAITTFLITDPILSDFRPTKDVDVVVEVSSYFEYTQLEKFLREKGFSQRIGSKDPICRWMIGSTVVDFMPTDTKILGFSNRWYKDVIDNYFFAEVPCGKSIKIVNPPYFIGTKIEAFLWRGKNDFIMSHDIEDIITVIDGRKELPEEIRNAPVELRQYIQNYLLSYEENYQFRDAISGYLPSDPDSQERFPIILKRIQEIY